MMIDAEDENFHITHWTRKYWYQYSANQDNQVENLPGGGGGGAEKDKYWVV